MTHIGSTYVYGGKIKDAEALSIVGIQLPSISATSMDDVDRNIDIELGWMDRAVAGFPGLDIVVFTECGLQGYHPVKWKEVLFENDLRADERFARLREKCKELEIWGVFNPLRKHEEHPRRNAYNTCVIVNADGEIVHQYNKVNPWSPVEPSFPGSEVPVTDGPKGSRLATIICSDGDYPEIWRECAFNGANIIIRVSAYMSPFETAWELSNRCSAYQNQCYVVAVNAVGVNESFSFFGRSMIVNPDGAVEVEAPRGLPWMIKANIYPKIVDQLRRQHVVSNFLYLFRHRGAGSLGLPDGDTKCPYRCYKNWKDEPILLPE